MTWSEYLKPRFRKACRDPLLIYRFLYSHVHKRFRALWLRRMFAGPSAELRAALAGTPPIPLSQTETGPRIHTLCGRQTLADAIASLKSFYRFAPAPYPLLIHDDGSLQSADGAFIQQHFPGARVILRAEADAVMKPRLEGLPSCARYRQYSVFGLKIFDLQHYSAGRPTLYLDSDILFFRPPAEIFEALRQPPEQWTNRYNLDVGEYYTWPVESIRRQVGIRLSARRVNAGLLCLRIPDPDWTLCEECFRLPERDYWLEQTLWAVELSRRGAAPLPPHYDVSFRQAWQGYPREECLARRWQGHSVLCEHYCGGPRYRLLFYDRAVALARDELSAVPTPSCA